MKKLLVVLIIFLLIGMSASPLIGIVKKSEKSTIGRAVLYVGGDGPENYTTIQAAVNDSSDGDTVFVYNGTYEEQILVNKSVVVEGESNINATVIGGFNISADNTTIKNFNISKGYEWNIDEEGFNGANKTGILVSSSNNIFCNNIISNITGGIGTYNASEWVFGKGGIGTGIYILSSHGNNINHNVFTSISGGKGASYREGGIGSGVYLENTAGCNISHNQFFNIIGGKGGPCGFGVIGSGVFLCSSSSNNISFNTFTNIKGGRGGSGPCLSIQNVKNQNIVSNKISRDSNCDVDGGYGIGIYLYFSSDNIVNMNNASGIAGGGAGDASHAGELGSGALGAGVYLESAMQNDIIFNNISDITGGEAWTYHFLGDCGYGYGILLQSSLSNNISGNVIFKVIGRGSDGQAGDGIGISLETSNSNNITSNILFNIIGGDSLNPEIYKYSFGRPGKGIELLSSSSNNISYNIIYDISGGDGYGSGSGNGDGGPGIGICLSTSVSNNIIAYNNIFNIIGGNAGYRDSLGSGGLGAGIYISTSNNIITHNNIYNVTGGKGGVSYGSDSGPGGDSAAIYMISSNHSKITSNNINYIKGGKGADGWILGGNAGDGGSGVGIYLQSSISNNLKSNIVSNITGGKGGNVTEDGEGGDGGIGNGIYLEFSDENNITSTIISNITGGKGATGEGTNGTDGIGPGIYFSSSSNNSITTCNVKNNEYGMYLRDYSNNSKIYHNNFINNTFNADDECDNNWDNCYPSGGNHWDDYIGEDDNDDGIGDTPYNISGGDNQDLYPLMHLFGPPYAKFEYVVDMGTVEFNASKSGDYNGYIVNYEWDFGDGTNGTGMIVDHDFSEVGTYDVTLTVMDNDGFEDDETKTVVLTNQPPNTPVINGPNSGKPDESYSYNFVAEDPNGDDVYYEIDWGEGSVEPWDGPHESNIVISRDHIWDQKGEFTIMARAKDEYGLIGEWGTFDVTMPKNKPFIFNFPVLSWLLNWFPNAFPLLRYLVGL